MWTDKLKYDPLKALLSSTDPALVIHTRSVFYNEGLAPLKDLWKLSESEKLITKQLTNGSWKYKGNRPGDAYGENYELLETWRNFRNLVEKYAMDRRHPSIERAAEYIFSCQTEEGDIRGILSNQYTPYYMGVMMEALIKAGYQDDDRIEKGFNWLKGMQQDEGGWIIPMSMFKIKDYYELCQRDPIPPVRSLPFSHLATGMVFRAYAAHPVYKRTIIAKRAGDLLKTRFFQKDTFTARQAKHFWIKFQFPFWWTNLLTVLDSLFQIDNFTDDPQVIRAIEWFIENQNEDGSWNTGYGKKGALKSDLWVTFAICRVLKQCLN